MTTENTKSDVMPCFWINRQQDTHRATAMEQWLDAGGWPHQRVEAVTPETLPQMSFGSQHHGIVRPTELACIASHLKAVALASEAGHEYSLILEDDIHPAIGWNPGELIASAPQDWEILQLHNLNPGNLEFLAKVYFQQNVIWHEWDDANWSAAAYIVNRKGMEKLGQLYMQEPGKLDLSIIQSVTRLNSEFALFKRVASYSSTLPLFRHDPAWGSSIHTHHLPLHEKALIEIKKAVGHYEATGGGHFPRKLKPA